MPEKETLEKSRKAKREGKAPSTQAGPFVEEEIDHVREGKHGARSTKQAIAIGLSKARRAGVHLPQRKGSPSPAKRPTKASPTRSRAMRNRLKSEGRSAVSKTALSRQARSAARSRTAADRSRAAKRAARTRARRGS
jgi:hypothetical protein